MSSLDRFVVFIMTLAVLATELVGERNFIISVDYASCTHNPEYIKSSNCSVDKSFYPPRPFLDLQLQRDVETAFYSLKVTLQNKYAARTFVDVKNQNICDFLEAKKTKILLSIVRNLSKKFGDIPKRCPIKKEFRFLFKNVTIDPDDFPSFTPDGHFTVKVTITNATNHVLGFSYECGGHIVRK